MSTERSYEEIVRAYEQARAEDANAFREYLAESGITITSPDHERAVRANYNVVCRGRIAALEALGVEFAVASAAMQQRGITATEKAAEAHATYARWAQAMDEAMDDRLVKGD